MTTQLNIKFEKAIRLLVEHLPVSDSDSRKPRLFHVIRVGLYLYEKNYSDNIVLGGILHDAIEWSNLSKEILKKEFGETITKIVLANTKNDSITDKHARTDELIKRCISNGEDALIVKTADILDSFKWYSGQDDETGLRYCMRNTNAIFKYKENNFVDPIFDELQTWKEKFANLSE